MPKIYRPDIKESNINFIKTPIHSIQHNSTAESLKANNLIGVITKAKDVNDTKTSTTMGDGILKLKDIHPIGNNTTSNIRRKKQNQDTLISMKF